MEANGLSLPDSCFILFCDSCAFLRLFKMFLGPLSQDILQKVTRFSQTSDTTVTISTANLDSVRFADECY